MKAHHELAVKYIQHLWSTYLPILNTWVIFYSLLTLLCLFINEAGFLE